MREVGCFGSERCGRSVRKTGVSRCVSQQYSARSGDQWTLAVGPLGAKRASPSELGMARSKNVPLREEEKERDGVGDRVGFVGGPFASSRTDQCRCTGATEAVVCPLCAWKCAWKCWKCWKYWKCACISAGTQKRQPGPFTPLARSLAARPRATGPFKMLV